MKQNLDLAPLAPSLIKIRKKDATNKVSKWVQKGTYLFNQQMENHFQRKAYDQIRKAKQVSRGLYTSH